MLKKIDIILCKIQEAILGFAILFMAAVLIGNFVARVIFQNSWIFAEELGGFVLIFVTFIGTTIAARYGEHITMTAFIDRFSMKVKLKIVAVTNLLTALLFIVLAVLAVQYVLYTKEIGFTSSALRVPMYLIYSVLPISFILSACEYLKHCYANLKKGTLLFCYEEDVKKEEEKTA